MFKCRLGTGQYLWEYGKGGFNTGANIYLGPVETTFSDGAWSCVEFLKFSMALLRSPLGTGQYLQQYETRK